MEKPLSLWWLLSPCAVSTNWNFQPCLQFHKCILVCLFFFPVLCSVSLQSHHSHLGLQQHPFGAELKLLLWQLESHLEEIALWLC